MKRLSVFFTLTFLASFAISFSQEIDFSGAIIYLPAVKNDAEIPARVLQEEVFKRSGIMWKLTNKIPNPSKITIALIEDNQVAKVPSAWAGELQPLSSITEEGFKLLLLHDSKTVLITGKNKRSLLYGVGWFLRKIEMRQQQVLVPQNISIATSPQFPIRGHQLGYRPKTNSYDAFSVAQFDQYIRELAFFGANSIEIMPPRTDDDLTSRHMKLAPIKMIAEQAKICQKYGLNVWMWYPNMGPDYTNADSIKSELKERREIFAAVPQIDELFVPGGDPGDLTPDVLFVWLDKVASVLHEYHPKAKIWISPQVFRPTQKWTDDFYAAVNKKYPWFGGVVFGPWINTPINEIRAKVDPSIPIRMYPDITHSLSSQYPIADWDLAYAMTLGRECFNPRPHAEKQIQNVFAKYGSGSISYSEGTNDDVNKFVWSGQDWDTTTAVIETLRDYARLLISPDYTEGIAQGIINLEKNFDGPLLASETVKVTLKQWQNMEKKASQPMLQNFRFQMCVLRAYYDAFIQQRLIHETAQEQLARNALATVSKQNADQIIVEAERLLYDSTESESLNMSYRTRCFELADSLYKSIGAQLTIQKHGAAEGRGNFLDNIDVRLNESPWLLGQLSAIEKISNKEEQLAAIDKMLHRTDAGPGGFYDNFGSVAAQRRVIRSLKWADDPGGILSPVINFGVGTKEDEWVHEILPRGFGGKIAPKAWMTQITTLYSQPLQIAYDELDTTAHYKMRIGYTGRFRSRMKLTANGTVIHDFLSTGDQPYYEFDIPKSVSAPGKIVFTWVCDEGEQGSQVSEIWLVKNHD